MSSTPLLSRWRAFAESDAFHADEANYSPLWAEFINDFKVGVDADSAATIDATVAERCRNYAIEAAGPLRRLEEAVLFYSGGLEGAVEKISRRAPVVPRWLASRLGVPMAAKLLEPRHYRVLSFLQREGVDVRQYIDDVGGAGARLQWNTMKAAYYLDTVLKHSDLGARWDAAPARIIEVGSGAGNLAALAFGRFKSVHYFAVDLPDMLLVCSHQLSRYAPEVRQILPNEHRGPIDAESLSGTDSTVHFLTPDQLDLIPARGFDLAFNSESFAEMTQEVAARYVHAFYDWLDDDGHYFVTNRESRALSDQASPTPNYSCFWTLPYRDDDDVVLHRHCPLRDAITDGRERNMTRFARVASRR